ncbi:rhomboid family intramembrane serine protease [Aridibaculum aurantiacum]|uniref:rhomboid family intramembrane serine protease n=1 Tax=Aridibaculum aurantiacum TaxID=2810307 RepID=UPI001A97C527|nr:rhomboid family intramembrane serine protease [Aridibaculum aurantiacum]
MTEFRPSRFEILPIVIKNLLIINLLFFLAKNSIGSSDLFNMVDVLALHHVKSPLFQPWQIVTHIFMHADFFHLFWNMFMLWMFGSVLENLWGPKRFLTFYFICGIGAGLLHLTFLWFDFNELLNQYMRIKENPSPGKISAFFNDYNLFRFSGSREVLSNYVSNPSNPLYLQSAVSYVNEYTYARLSVPTVGASGAVSGVMAAFLFLFPNTYLYLYFLFPIKVKWFGLFYFGRELVLAIMNQEGDNIARWAHIGGGLVGFLLVLTWNKKNRRKFY